MRTIFLLLSLVIAGNVFTQGLDVSIETDKTEYSGYSYNKEADPILITCKIKNGGLSPVTFRLASMYSLNFVSKEGEFSNNHCFRLNLFSENGSWHSFDESERTKEAFVTIEPGSEYVHSSKFSIGWLCRSGPPFGNWTFDIRYSRNVTAQDNYYLVKSYYTEKPEKVFVSDAWTGSLESNIMRVTITDR